MYVKVLINAAISNILI